MKDTLRQSLIRYENYAIIIFTYVLLVILKQIFFLLVP